MTTFRSIVAWLTALSADPSQIDREPPRAAAAVAVAYAGFAVDAPPSPAPTPAKGCGCEGKCEAASTSRTARSSCRANRTAPASAARKPGWRKPPAPTANAPRGR
jgi:hypothetical protein